MGFIDYAWAISLQKDDTKVKIIQDPNIDQPQLKTDDLGFTIKLPTPKFLENDTINFLGYNFDNNTIGKVKIGRLFRASIFHLSTHTLLPFSKDNGFPKKSDSNVEAFVKSLITDTYVNTYLQDKMSKFLNRHSIRKCLGFSKDQITFKNLYSLYKSYGIIAEKTLDRLP